MLSKVWLWLSVASNLSMLGFFKYGNFLLENFTWALARGGIHMRRHAPPLGRDRYRVRRHHLGDDRLRGIRISGPDGEEELAVDACFVFIGASPHTDWLAGVVARDERGFILAGPEARHAGWPRSRAPLHQATRGPGECVGGAGRARSSKRVASAVGEGSMAVSLIHEYLATA